MAIACQCSVTYKVEQTHALLDYSRERAYPLAAVELFDEPNLALSNLPVGYDPLNYAADTALLWQRLMGRTVLELATLPADQELIVYTHCTADVADAPDGAVTTLILNVSLVKNYEILINSENAHVYVLSSDELQSSSIQLNMSLLTVGEDGIVGELLAQKASPILSVLPTTATFIVDRSAANPDCY